MCFPGRIVDCMNLICSKYRKGEELSSWSVTCRSCSLSCTEGQQIQGEKGFCVSDERLCSRGLFALNAPSCYVYPASLYRQLQSCSSSNYRSNSFYNHNIPSTHRVMLFWVDPTLHQASSWMSPPLHCVLGFPPHLLAPLGSPKASIWILQFLKSPEIIRNERIWNDLAIEYFEVFKQNLNLLLSSSWLNWWSEKLFWVRPRLQGPAPG